MPKDKILIEKAKYLFGKIIFAKINLSSDTISQTKKELYKRQMYSNLEKLNNLFN